MVRSARAREEEPDEDFANLPDLLERITTTRLHIIDRDPRVRRAVVFAVNSTSASGADRNLGRALILGLRACQIEARSPHRVSGHRRLQNAFRKSSDARLAQPRHEYTGHGAGQLEALLALGYCRGLNKPTIRTRLLRPWAAGFTPASWRGPRGATRPVELDEEFKSWVDKIRGRIKRMRRKLEGNELNARAVAAFDTVIVFLRGL
jgi:hypothetical protein